MSYERLYNQAIEGNDEAFLELINSVRIDLYKTALAYLRNEGDALEALQEVTYRAYSSLSELREPRYFKTWLIRIMINYCNDTIKKQKRLILNEKLLFIEGDFDNHYLFEIEDAMQSLDERSREMIILKYFHDLKIKEIAQAFNCPEGTIKTWLYKALKLLREKLEEKGGISNV